MKEFRLVKITKSPIAHFTINDHSTLCGRSIPDTAERNPHPWGVHECRVCVNVSYSKDFTDSLILKGGK